MSKLVNETRERNAARRIINPTKAGAEIYVADNATSSFSTPETSYEGKSYHYITEIVKAELLSCFMKAKAILTARPEDINKDLEILQDDNFVTVRKFINSNLDAFCENLDESIRRLTNKTNFHGTTVTDDSEIYSIIESLYGRYTFRCLNPKSPREEVRLMNKCLKMLLEIKVLGLVNAKNNNSNID